VGANSDEVVGIEDLQVFQKQAQSPGNRCQPAFDGRRERDATKFIAAIGKQTLNFGKAVDTHVGVVVNPCSPVI
jgi:hypothetical protein